MPRHRCRTGKTAFVFDEADALITSTDGQDTQSLTESRSLYVATCRWFDVSSSSSNQLPIQLADRVRRQAKSAKAVREEIVKNRDLGTIWIVFDFAPFHGALPGTVGSREISYSMDSHVGN